jgi:hypothetical protein
MSEEKVNISTKRKNIQQLLDYCMDNRISFTINPKGLAADEFDATLTVNGIKEALALGMFVKEFKFEVLGLAEAKHKTTVSTSVKKVEAKEGVAVKNETPKVEQQSTTAPLNF